MPLSVPPKALNSPIHHPHGPSFSSISKPKPKPNGLTLLPLNRAFRGLEISVPSPSSLHSNVAKHVDVATLSNLCVDIVLNVPQLPPPSPLQRKAFMDRLAQAPPDKVLSLTSLLSPLLTYIHTYIERKKLWVF